MLLLLLLLLSSMLVIVVFVVIFVIIIVVTVVFYSQLSHMIILQSILYGSTYILILCMRYIYMHSMQL